MDILAYTLACLAAALIGAGVAALYFRQRPAQRPMRPLVVNVPSFGAPAKVVYRRADYGDEPLRCSGDRCGHHLLADGETFYEIPLPENGPGAMVAVCLPCGDAAPTPATEGGK
jgi:hypothetical protein